MTTASDTTLLHRLHRYKYLSHVVVALIAGAGFIYAASRYTEHATTHNILNELGIAIVIASIVTLMYETYAREVLAQETMSTVISTVMAGMFDPELWEELRQQLLNKTAVRRECIVRLRLEPHDKLPPHQMVLWVSLSYRIHPLRIKAKTVDIRHNLDQFMQNEALDLPRFTHIEVGADVIDPRPLQGKLECKVPVDSSPYGTNVIIERREIVYIPGAYHLIMSELTFVENVYIEDVPADVGLEVNWTIDNKPVKAHQSCTVKRLLMPGHAIEFRFGEAKERPARDVGLLHESTA